MAGTGAGSWDNEEDHCDADRGLPRVARQYHYVVIISLAPRGSDFFYQRSLLRNLRSSYVTCGRKRNLRNLRR